MSYDLDKKDRKILFELDKNSRATIKQIAEKTGYTRDVVSYRIKNLEEEGIIKDYITIIDFSKFGYNLVRLYLKLQNSTPEKESEMIEFFVNQKNTLTVYKTDGSTDIAVGFLVKDMVDYQNTYSEFLSKFKKYVYEDKFSIFLDYVHFDRNYLVEEEYREETEISTSTHKNISYDEKDILLLNEIKENSRMSLMELSKKLDMSAPGVKHKLERLEDKKAIVAYKVLIDTEKLGYEYYKVDLTLEDMSIVPTLHEFIKEHPNVTYRNVSAGGSDFEFDCEFKNSREFYALMEELKSMFPEKIRRYSYYKAIEIFKYSYLPERIK